MGERCTFASSRVVGIYRIVVIGSIEEELFFKVQRHDCEGSVWQPGVQGRRSPLGKEIREGENRWCRMTLS
jgi:hypothetical protein